MKTTEKNKEKEAISLGFAILVLIAFLGAILG
jgi:hypothetical protein